MARWVSPAIASEVMRLSITEVMNRVNRGELETLLEGAFTFINLDTTYCVVTPEERAALVDEPINLANIRENVAIQRRRPIAA